MCRDAWRFEKGYEELGLFADTYTNKINPLFSNIEEESKEIAEEHYREMGIDFNPDYHDEADFAEAAWEAGLEHYEGMGLMKFLLINFVQKELRISGMNS